MESPTLHHHEFVPHDITGDLEASPGIGFIDPKRIIRGVHILPEYHHSEDESSLPLSSTACLPSEEDFVYKLYYEMQ